MKRLLFALGVLFAAAAPGIEMAAQDAAEEATMLTLERKDGTKSNFWLTAEPVITFEESLMVVTTPDVEVKLDRADLDYFHFTRDSQSAIESVTAGGDYLFKYVNNTVTASGNGVAMLRVYDINGIMVKEVAGNGFVTADLNDLHRGVYVVAVEGKQAVKVSVK